MLPKMRCPAIQGSARCSSASRPSPQSAIQKLAKTHAFGLSARRRLADVDGVEAGLAVVSDLVRVQLTDQFEPELNEMDDDRRITQR
jgi:hypothetical protein